MGRTWRKRNAIRRGRSLLTQCASERIKELYSWIILKGFRPSRCMLHLAATRSGRGLVCLKPLQTGDVIIDLPKSLLITKQMVQSFISDIPADFSTEEILSIFIITESRRGVRSCWWPYIKSLPSHFDSPLTYQQVDALPKGIQRTFDMWRVSFFRSKQRLSSYFNLRTEDVIISDAEFLWSWCVVNTRCIFVEGHGCALAPFLDMLNHHWAAHVTTTYKDGHFVITSGSAYRPGEEVFINYGSHDNRKLLCDYGFVLEDNPNDCIPVELCHIETLHGSRKFARFEEKMCFLDKLRFFTQQTGFTIDGPTWNLKVVLQVLQDMTSLGPVQWKQHVIESSEIRHRLLESVLSKIMLEDYRTDLVDGMLNKLVYIEKSILCKCAFS